MVKITTKVKDVFHKAKWMSIFYFFEDDTYTIILSKKCNISYSYIVPLISESIKRGYITYRKDGRIKRLFLTEKGKILKQAVKEIYSIINFS